MNRDDLGRLIRTTEFLSFDCYGTLVDWERGLLDGFRDILGIGDEVADDELLAYFSTVEPEVQAESPSYTYRAILQEVGGRIGARYGLTLDEAALVRFASSVGDWPPFPDTVAALSRLAGRFRLCILSNVDDESFVGTQRQLGVDFAHVVTAEQVGCYKPDLRMFDALAERLGVEDHAWEGRVVHIAQSLFHDHAPAAEIGLPSVWIDRRGGRGGGAARDVAELDKIVSFPTLAAFTNWVGSLP